MIYRFERNHEVWNCELHDFTLQEFTLNDCITSFITISYFICFERNREV